jgi:hypothetical protein
MSNHDEYSEMLFFPKEGDIVWDDLTASKAKIIKVSVDRGCVGYWLDNDYLGGGRHPWEISKTKEEE